MLAIFITSLCSGCYPDETVKTVVLPSENTEIDNPG